MNMNCWANEFMNELRKFYKTSDLAFVYDDVFNTFGVGCSNSDLLYKGDNDVYTSFDFERILNNLWTNLQWNSGLDAKFTFLVVQSGLREK